MLTLTGDRASHAPFAELRDCAVRPATAVSPALPAFMNDNALPLISFLFAAMPTPPPT